MKHKKKGTKRFSRSRTTIFATQSVVILILISITASIFTGQSTVSMENEEELLSKNYLKVAIKSPIEDLNPLTMPDKWSSMTASDPIYSGLSAYHEASGLIIPWMAYDWSPIGPSGDGTYDPSLNYVGGVYDPSQAYNDTDPDTVENEALPSGDLEIVVRMRPGILFHRANEWTNDTWQSPKNSNFTMPMDTMRYATAHDIVFAGEMLQWEAPLFMSGFLPLLQNTLGDKGEATDPNWVVNGGTGMYEGMQLYNMSDDPERHVCDYSIRFELERPYSMFYHTTLPMAQSMNVWAEHTLLDTGANQALNWDLGEGGTTEDQKAAIVGTGPFMWDDWVPGNYIRLIKNPDYWVDGTRDMDRPYGLSMNDLDYRSWIDGIYFSILYTTDDAFQSLKQGEIDIFAWNTDPGYISAIQDEPELDLMSTPDFGFHYMGFNMRQPAFGYKDYPGSGAELGTWYGEDISLKFRQAVTHATDKSYIVNNLLQGYGAVGWSVVSPDNNLYHNRTVQRYAYDIDITKQLLEEQNEIWRNELIGFNTVWTAPGSGEDPAPYPIPRKDAAGNIYEDTSTFYLRTPTADYDSTLAKSGQRVADTLRAECGVNIHAQPMNFQTLTRKLDPGIADFDMYMLSWSIDDFESLASLESFFHSRNDIPGSYNIPGLRSSEFDNITEDAEAELDQDNKIKLVKQLQGVISQNLAYNVLYFRSQINSYRNEWSGWVPRPAGICNLFSYANVRKYLGVEIWTWHDLHNVRYNLSAKYVLMNDLTPETTGYLDYNDPATEGWLPIGNDTNPFTGSLDGQNYTITELYINRLSTNYIGLFGYVGEGGGVRNVGVIDTDISGNVYVGGLVGINYYGTVSNSYATGSVSGTEHAGGLVGVNDGMVENSYATGNVSGIEHAGGLVGGNYGTVSNSYATGNVSGDQYVGGLVGFNRGTVTNSYATGSVSGNWDVGGLVGRNLDGTVENSYATGTVNGEWNVGGFVGYNFDWGTVSNSYATGSVSGDGSVGGLVGINTGTVNNSFWDTETSGTTSSDGGTGKTTAEMMDITTFSSAGWDIALAQDHDQEIWYIDDGNDYPRLWWEEYVEPVTFDVSLIAGGDMDGWNFVSFNLELQDTSLTSILTNIEGDYDKVMYYDAPEDRWQSYVPGRAEHFNNLQSWNHHMGIWICMTNSTTLTIEGYVPTSTDITLYPGWNMVGLPSNTAGNHGLPSEITRIGYFNASAEYNMDYDYEPANFTFEPGQGYMLYNGADEAVVWTVEY